MSGLALDDSPRSGLTTNEFKGSLYGDLNARRSIMSKIIPVISSKYKAHANTQEAKLKEAKRISGAKKSPELEGFISAPISIISFSI